MSPQTKKHHEWRIFVVGRPESPQTSFYGLNGKTFRTRWRARKILVPAVLGEIPSIEAISVTLCPSTKRSRTWRCGWLSLAKTACTRCGISTSGPVGATSKASRRSTTVGSGCSRHWRRSQLIATFRAIVPIHAEKLPPRSSNWSNAW